jgi:hypothetical protein
MEGAKLMNDFKENLRRLLNCESAENGSDTPDFILAQYLLDCLDAFDKAANRRSVWYKKSEQN